MEAKAELRKKIRARLRQLSQEEISAASLLIRDRLTFPSGSKVAIFAGLSTEPMLLELIRERNEIAWFFPKVMRPGEMEFFRVTAEKDLTRGAFGILEPPTEHPAEQLDAIVCPGVAFTRDGKRLGQGGGFYDRAILKFPTAKLLGVAFDCQLVDELPTEVHDCTMQRVITPSAEF